MNRGSLWLVIALVSMLTEASTAQEKYAPVGLFIGSIEEGARIFTPARLLPFEHPEALGHEFPTAQQLYGSEFPALLWLGEQAGYRLWPTLQRYPTEPSPDWPYPSFRPPPGDSLLETAEVIRRPTAESVLPGLRAALFEGDALVLFIVDTRNMSLADRGMGRATAMGLDVTRAEFLEALAQVETDAPGTGLRAVIFVQ